jgi:hypothetical protein
MLPSVTGITLESLLPSTNRRLAHIVSGNNQIGFDLPVDNLKTGKVRKKYLSDNLWGTGYFSSQSTTLHKRGE